MANDTLLHFRLSWAQRQFILYLASRGKHVSLSPESEHVKQHWDKIVELKQLGVVIIVDMVGRHHKEISLTTIGENLVTMIKDGLGTTI